MLYPESGDVGWGVQAEREVADKPAGRVCKEESWVAVVTANRSGESTHSW